MQGKGKLILTGQVTEALGNVRVDSAGGNHVFPFTGMAGCRIESCPADTMRQCWIFWYIEALEVILGSE